MEITANFLLTIPMFKNAQTEHLEALLARDDTEVLLFAAGTRIQENEKYLGILLSGNAQVRSNDTGRTVILRMLRPRDLFGAAALFCPEELPLSRIEALEDCRVLRFSTDGVRELLTKDTAVLDAFLTFLAGRVRYLNRKICCFTAGSAVRRLALWLLSEEREDILLPTSLSALADMLDIARASLYRAFDTLAAQGLIEKRARSIQILDRNRLSEIFDPENERNTP